MNGQNSLVFLEYSIRRLAVGLDVYIENKLFFYKVIINLHSLVENPLLKLAKYGFI